MQHVQWSSLCPIELHLDVAAEAVTSLSHKFVTHCCCPISLVSTSVARLGQLCTVMRCSRHEHNGCNLLLHTHTPYPCTVHSSCNLAATYVFMRRRHGNSSSSPQRWPSRAEAWRTNSCNAHFITACADFVARLICCHNSNFDHFPLSNVEVALRPASSTIADTLANECATNCADLTNSDSRVFAPIDIQAVSVLLETNFAEPESDAASIGWRWVAFGGHSRASVKRQELASAHMLHVQCCLIAAM
jgi:hypothetical protein